MPDRKVALITGASRGIGRAIALRFAQDGINVVINYKSDRDGAAEVEKLCAALGVETLTVQGDVSKLSDVEKMFLAIKGRFVGLDILVNNAGITRDGLAIAMKPQDFTDVIDVNLLGAFYTMKFAARIMAKNRAGSIVNITSVVGLRGNPGQINYAAGKAGIIGMTKTLAKELAGRNIRVNAVAPGFIDTAMTQKLPTVVKRKLLDSIPLGRFGDCADVAHLVKFLVSGEAQYITGQVISVDGGMNI